MSRHPKLPTATVDSIAKIFIGESIRRRIATGGWGKSTITSLAAYLRRRDPNARGFSAQNLWRMRQFYETYSGQPKLSPLVRELSRTHKPKFSWSQNVTN